MASTPPRGEEKRDDFAKVAGPARVASKAPMTPRGALEASGRAGGGEDLTGARTEEESEAEEDASSRAGSMPSVGLGTFGKELEHPFMTRGTSRIRQELGLPEGGRPRPKPGLLSKP